MTSSPARAARQAQDSPITPAPTTTRSALRLALAPPRRPCLVRLLVVPGGGLVHPCAGTDPDQVRTVGGASRPLSRSLPAPVDRPDRSAGPTRCPDRRYLRLPADADATEQLDARPASTSSARPRTTRTPSPRCSTRALAGGADLIQLRDKDADDERLLAAAPTFRAAADRHGALFLINDRPDLVAACARRRRPRRPGRRPRRRGAPPRRPRRDRRPLHPLARAARAAHAATGDDRPDYISVGPVWATPTKPGRPAAGLELRPARRRGSATLPWFAIGGHRRRQRRRGRRGGSRAGRRRPRDPRRRRPRGGRRERCACRSATSAAVRRVSSRERKRADRRKRKERSAAAPHGADGDADGDTDAGTRRSASPRTDSPPRPRPGISRSELRNERGARASSSRSSEGERPRVVTIGAVLSLLIAASIVDRLARRRRGRQVGNTDIERAPERLPGLPARDPLRGDGLGMLARALLGGARVPGDHGDHHGRRFIALIAADLGLPGDLASLVLVVAGTSSGSRSRRWRGSRCPSPAAAAAIWSLIESRAMAESSYDVIVIGSGPGRLLAADPRRPARAEDRRGREGRDRRPLPQLRLHPGEDAPPHRRDLRRRRKNGAEIGIMAENITHRLDEAPRAPRGGPQAPDRRRRRSLQEQQDRPDRGRGRRSPPTATSRSATTTYETKNVILATGSVALPIPGVEFGDRVLDTWGAWSLPELPKSIAVVGAGASGSEIASAYARFGTEVKLLEMLAQILPAEDKDMARVVERTFKKQGIEVVTGATVENVEAGTESVKFTYGDESAEVDYLVIAGGRGADVEALGLDEAGLEARRRRQDRRRRVPEDLGRRHLRDRRHHPRARRSPTRPRRRASSRPRRSPGRRPTRSTATRSPAPPSATRRSPASA